MCGGSLHSSALKALMMASTEHLAKISLSGLHSLHVDWKAIERRWSTCPVAETHLDPLPNIPLWSTLEAVERLKMMGINLVEDPLDDDPWLRVDAQHSASTLL